MHPKTMEAPGRALTFLPCCYKIKTDSPQGAALPEPPCAVREKGMILSMIQIAPSILSADFASLGNDIRRVEQAGADVVHIDVMDGVFVPNLSIGLPVVKCVRPVSALPFDVHLMIVEPWKYLEAFAKAGADWLTFHLETSSDPGVIHAALQKIQSLGMKAGLSVKPATPPEAIFPFLGGLDLVLVMTVEPGFGNQKMIPECLEKVRVIRQEAERRGLSPLISIDGGVNAATAEAARASGCDIMVAGSAVFGAEEPAQMIRLLRGGNRNG